MIWLPIIQSISFTSIYTPTTVQIILITQSKICRVFLKCFPLIINIEVYLKALNIFFAKALKPQATNLMCSTRFRLLSLSRTVTVKTLLTTCKAIITIKTIPHCKKKLRKRVNIRFPFLNINSKNFWKKKLLFHSATIHSIC